MFGEYEFVTETIEQSGAEYVEKLVEQGFVPVLTNLGWRWIQQKDKKVKQCSLNTSYQHYVSSLES